MGKGYEHSGGACDPSGIDAHRSHMLTVRDNRSTQCDGTCTLAVQLERSVSSDRQRAAAETEKTQMQAVDKMRMKHYIPFQRYDPVGL